MVWRDKLLNPLQFEALPNESENIYDINQPAMFAGGAFKRQRNATGKVQREMGNIKY